MELQERLFESNYLIDPYNLSDLTLPATSERRTARGEQASKCSTGAEGPRGLSKYHILPYTKQRHKELAHLPCPTEVEYWVEANLIKVKQKRFPRNNQHIKFLTNEEGELLAIFKEIKEVKRCRGVIKQFSKASRLRLMELLAKLNRMVKPYFLTLTYPSWWPSVPETKVHLRNFIKRLKRRYGEKLGYIWKLEFQQRGAPHYHLFLWGINDFEGNSSECRGWFADTWADVCKTNDENHVKAGTSLDKIRTWKGVRSYGAKYFGKIDENERAKGIGRVWGYGGNIPFSAVLKLGLEPKQRHKLLRYLRKRIRTESKRMRRFIVQDPWIWFLNHMELVDPIPF